MIIVHNIYLVAFFFLKLMIEDNLVMLAGILFSLFFHIIFSKTIACSINENEKNEGKEMSCG